MHRNSLKAGRFIRFERGRAGLQSAPRNRYHLPSVVSQSIEIIAPPLHHYAALGEVANAVVGAPERVTNAVRKLVLNQV